MAHQQTIIERLRQLKQMTSHNKDIITTLKTPSHYTYHPTRPDYFTKPFQIEQLPTQDLYSQMMTDFERRNQHIIDSQLHYERSQELLHDILGMVNTVDEEELDRQLDRLSMHDIDSVSKLVNAINVKPTILPQNTTQVKTITITPAETTQQQLLESAPTMDDLSYTEQELVSEYVEACYSHLIKVLKVYFILADGKSYRLPSIRKIQHMKELLEGHIHIPDTDVRRGKIPPGTHVYYLSIDDNSSVQLMEGHVFKKAKKGMILIDEKNNKKKHIDFKCPVFRKINNLDIATYIKKRTR
jgi:hypothetical protein